MIHLPVKAGKDLADYLHCLDHAVRFKYPKDAEHGCPLYNWHGVVIIPDEKRWDAKLLTKFRQTGNISQTKIAPPSRGAPDATTLNDKFPKLAALAGYRKDKNIKKGWICYENHTVCICTGSARTVKPQSHMNGSALANMSRVLRLASLQN
jgi:hypothetical protein